MSFLETLNRTICQMQLSDVEFFYSFIKKEKKNLRATLRLKPKTINFNYTYPTYLPTYPILSYLVSIYLEKSKTNVRIKSQISKFRPSNSRKRKQKRKIVRRLP